MIQAKQIARFFDHGSFVRGMDYAAQNRASLSTQSQQQAQVNLAGICKGSLREPYHQHIKLTLNRKTNAISALEGTCTCPLGYNCKHVVALLLTWLREMEPRQSGPAVERRGRSSGVENTPVSSQVLYLLNQVDQDVAPVARAASTASRQLAYVLSAERPSLAILSARRLKNGGLGVGSAVRLARDRFMQAGYPDFYLDDDIPIVQLAEAISMEDYAEGIELEGELGATLLKLAVATGRCYLDNTDNPPLSLGKTREGELCWRMQEDGTQVPAIHIGKEFPETLPLIPLWYIDDRHHQVGELVTELPPHLVQHILQLPVLSAAEARLVRGRLEKLPYVAQGKLPLPEVDDESPLPQPKAILRLLTSHFKHSVGYGMNDARAVAELYFEYPGVGRLSGSAHPTLVSKIPTPQGLQVVRRNVDFELRIYQMLRELGLNYGERRYASNMRLDSNEPCLLPDNIAVEFWTDLLLNQAPRLGREGLILEVLDDFPYRMAAPDDWYIEVGEPGSGIDWFDLDLGVLIDGERVSLVATLVKLLQRPGFAAELEKMAEDRLLPIELPDGRLMPIEVKRLRAWLAPLLELASLTTAEDLIRVPKLHAAHLAELEAVPAHWIGGDRLRDLGRQLKSFAGIAHAAPAPGLKATLRPYQQQGLDWLQFLREYGLAGILADDMGLGKTLQTLAHIQLEKYSGRAQKPSLVVAPTSLMPNWRKEAEKFTPDLRVLVLHGSNRGDDFKKIQEADLVLTTYPLLVRDQKELLNQSWHLLVLDEAQFIKNPKAQAHKVALKIEAEHRLSLTGTPLENHLGELWAQFNFLMPGFLGNAKQFSQNYRTPIEKNADVDRQERLNERVRPFLLRRTKESVLSDLPPKTEIVRFVELQGAQLDLYESLRATYDAKLREAIAEMGVAKSQIMILDALLKLRQACCDPRLVKSDAAAGVDESAKLELLTSMLAEQVDEGRKILVFSQFTSMLALIEAEVKKLGIPYVVLTGETRDRETPVNTFQQGKAPIFLISLKAGGTGLNLTAADTVIHYDPWWNPAAEAQASARAHRIGQDKPVFVYKLLSQGTVEEKILAMQERKRGLAENLLNTGVDGHLISSEDLELLFQSAA